MNKSIKMVVVLGAIALLSGLALGGLHQLTYERAQNNILKFKKIPAVADIRQLVGLTGARELYVQDDIFVTDAAWVEEFCDRLAAERLDLIWSCESRFVGVDDALLTRMRRAGCWRISTVWWARRCPCPGR